MGRGRQKAKHMKVARSLKYFSPETDLDALQRELTGTHDTKLEPIPDEDSDSDDKWSEDSWDAPSSYSDAWEDYRD
ncbi:DUF3073 domain-containing protein [Actinomyces minihominis]|uniref:DUF3073 domain-containing protein n=1 Tax=Actinomyces minihominis TaxID=2002838 RepID=UPI000C089931|nr:DUF3073 domain-containing protein [Actinomyces minihominis]